MLELGTQHHVIAAFPIDAGTDDVQSFGSVLGKGYLVRMGIDQRGKTVSDGLGLPEQGVLVDSPVYAIIEIARHRRLHVGGKRSPASKIEVCACLHDGEFLPNDSAFGL